METEPIEPLMAGNFEDGESSSALGDWFKQDRDKWTAIEEELASLDPEASPAIHAYLTQQLLERDASANPSFIRSNTNKVKLVQRIFVDVDQKPDNNWVGKIIGAKGKNAQRIASLAQVKIAIEGKGSAKLEEEEEARLADDGTPEHAHLKHPLHVKIESFASLSRAWRNMQYAIDMVLPLVTHNPSEMLEANAVAAVTAVEQRKLQRRAASVYEGYGDYEEYEEFDYGFAAPSALRGRPRFHPYAAYAPPFPSRGRGRGRGRPY